MIPDYERVPLSLGYKLKVFSSNSFVEIHTESGREIVNWAGFNASDFGDDENHKHAAFLVRAANSYDVLVTALELAAKVLKTKPGNRNKPEGTSEGTAQRAIAVALETARGR